MAKKLTETQIKLLAHMRAGNTVSITVWGGQTLTSNAPCGNITTLRRLCELNLVKVKQTGVFHFDYEAVKS